jgi:SAM-dependent methyltransferase
MRQSFPGRFLRCPVCHTERSLTLEARAANDVEVREGTLRCGHCTHAFGVHRGVGELLVDPPQHVRREAEGLERFAAHMRESGWDRDRILNLPDEPDDGYWFVQAATFDQLIDLLKPQPGQSIVDVGSNTCWATNRFARAGLNAIALDIATAELQGLYTADFFLEEGSYFERILGTMSDMPIASASLDYVYCCEVLHHNDLRGLWRTFREAHRVLKPGGKLLVANETLKTLRDPHGLHVEGVAEYEGYEHAHWALHYELGARAAGFSIELIEPAYRWIFDPHHLWVPADTPPLEATRRVVHYVRRRWKPTRRLQLAWINHVIGGSQFSMIATKPVTA